MFSTDRAWLFYPCNPDLRTFEVSFESTTPGYPGAKTLNEIVPMTPNMADYCIRALSRAGESVIDPPPGQVMTNDIALRFDVKSLMFMALRPQIGDAWMFGLHQCDHERAWTHDDKQLFRVIGNRITNCISNMVYLDHLRESEERFRMLARGAFEAIVVHDEGRILQANPQFYDMFGYSPEELSGKDAMAYTFSEESLGPMRGQIAQGDSGPCEAKGKKKDGTEFPVEIQARVVDYEGRLRRMVAIRDVSERKRLVAQLEQSQKMKAIGTLAGGIAHDFNNILGIIVGNTELAMFDIPEWSPARESLKEVREASLRARDLVTQILLFARQKEHAVSHIRVEPIAVESLRMLRASIPSTVEIRQEIQADLPAVLADSAQIQQIVMNLCTNAGQVMEADGGVLTFELDLADLSSPLATQTGRLPEGRYVRIRVRDTGPGIPSDHLERIFEPFFTTKGVGEGTGLGLAVVHGIVQDRQGGILVESEQGKGTAFTVFLPVSDERPTEEPPEQEHELPSGVERILFVDDEPMIMKLGQGMLERQGYLVETRASGTDALECFRQDPMRFDLIVTDTTMPGLRGDKLAEEMMKIRPGMPVILSSGFSRQISEEKAKELGVRAFLMKPFTAQELANTVRNVLNEEIEGDLPEGPLPSGKTHS
jgi:PAS domain S-box-containing protein